MKRWQLQCWVSGILLLAVSAAGIAEPPKTRGDEKRVQRVETIVVGGEPHDMELEWVSDEDGKVKILGLEESGLGRLLQRGFLGVELTEMTPELRQHFGASRDQGVLVARVVEDGPAAGAGVRVGDLITAINGETVESGFDVRRTIGSLEEGDAASLDLIRGGRRLTVEATIQERERPQVDVRRLVHRLPRSGDDGHFVFHFQGEGFPEMVEGLRARVESPEFHREVIDLRSRERELLDRLEALESRLQELEAELSKRR